MTATKILLALIVVFFIILGVYLKINNAGIEGGFARGGTFKDSTISGNYLILLSFLFLIPLIYLLRGKK